MLSGPSCVGKGPLCQALETLYPRLANQLHKLVLYNSRKPRPGELEGVDYYFRSRDEMEALGKNERFVLLNIRGDLQGVDLDDLSASIGQGEDIFFEGNPFVPQALWELPELKQVSMLRVFLSPLSRSEILWYKELGVNLEEMVTDIQRRKLLRRTQKQKGFLSLPDLENIEKRARSAPVELRLAWQFDWVIPNHDGEDSENWNAFYYPVGDALKAVQCFAGLLQRDHDDYAERWEKKPVAGVKNRGGDNQHRPHCPPRDLSILLFQPSNP
jgi:Guanylate kinase